MEPKIMMVGVLPPPVHGQSLATQALFEADLSPIRKIIVPIRSSKELPSVGKFSLRKAVDLLAIIGRTWKSWLIHRPRVLYYTAGSGAWVPFLRDVIFLLSCRPLFGKTLIHYHSGNLPDFLESSPIASRLGRIVYGRGAWTIRLGESCPAPIYPGNRVFDVPNGLDAPDIPPKKPSGSFRILFLGNLFETKGVIDLIDAISIVASKSTLPLELNFVGGFVDDSFTEVIHQRLAALPATVITPAPAPAYGDEKWAKLANSDVLVFPSYYPRENLPLVIIEAMAAGLPAIGTAWRGIPSLIEDGKNGFIVPVMAPDAIAAALLKLIENPGLRLEMGSYARSLYEQKFTTEHYVDNLGKVMLRALSTPAAERPAPEL